MSLAPCVAPSPLSPHDLLAEVARLYHALRTAPQDQRLILEAAIRASSEQYWACELEQGDQVIGKVGGRRRPSLVLAR
jgi:hypothetical protein